MKLCKTIDKKKSNAIFRHVPISRKFGVEIPGRDPKKSRNLIAVLCYFCEWLDFWRFVRFRVGVAGNGDVAPPSFTVELYASHRIKNALDLKEGN